MIKAKYSSSFLLETLSLGINELFAYVAANISVTATYEQCACLLSDYRHATAYIKKCRCVVTERLVKTWSPEWVASVFDSRHLRIINDLLGAYCKLNSEKANDDLHSQCWDTTHSGLHTINSSRQHLIWAKSRLVAVFFVRISITRRHQSHFDVYYYILPMHVFRRVLFTFAFCAQWSMHWLVATTAIYMRLTDGQTLGMRRLVELWRNDSFFFSLIYFHHGWLTLMSLVCPLANMVQMFEIHVGAISLVLWISKF